MSQELADRLAVFVEMGLPPILAVKAANENMDAEEVRAKLPNKKAVILGVGSDLSGRGKSMLVAAVCFKNKNIDLVDSEGFSQNNSTRYLAALVESGLDPQKATPEQMMGVIKNSLGDDVGDERKVSEVVNEVWLKWFENNDKDIILVDLIGRGEDAGYPENSFGLLKFAMASYVVKRITEENWDEVSAAVDTTPEVLEGHLNDFDNMLSGLLSDDKELNRMFKDSFKR
jgi:hypothetical protein